MMIGILMLFGILPALALAGITVDIKAGKDMSEAKVDVLGSDIDIISDKETATFNLAYNDLKECVWKYWTDRGNSGGWPTHAYLRSPTPWGDLYKKYKCDQVQRILRPTTFKILSLRTKPTVVAKKEFTNNSSLSATYDAAIQQSVSQTASSSWSKNGEFSFIHGIHYKVHLKVAEVEQLNQTSNSFGYTSRWGEGSTKSITSTIGSKSGLKVELKPGQAVVSQLTANKGTMEVQVDYEIVINGDVAINYERTFKGHRFYCLDVNTIMENHGDKVKFKSRETLKIEYYSDARIVVTDASQSDVVIYSSPVSIKLDEEEAAASLSVPGYD